MLILRIRIFFLQ